MVGTAHDGVVDVIVNPFSGNIKVDYDGLEALQIEIESAQGVFDGSSSPQWDMPGFIRTDTDHVISNLTFGIGFEGIDDLGDGILGEIPPDLNLLHGLTVRVVATGGHADHHTFATFPPRLMAGNVIVVPEPDRALLLWFTVALAINISRVRHGCCPYARCWNLSF
jgi:hypothetical protein